jgi:hypothetical protein
MEDFWSSFITLIGSGTIVLAGIAWLIKSMINNFLSKNIEAYKLNLKSNSEITIEELKNELRRKSFENEIMFERLHQKRANIIADLYSKLVISVQSVESFLAPFEYSGAPTKNEKYKKTVNDLINFINFFERNRIYFSENLCILIDDFIHKTKDPTFEFASYLNLAEADAEDRKEKLKVWSKTWKSVDSIIKPAKEIIEKEFRSILGVN